MNITFWPPEFQDYLRNRYHYDPVEGIVTFRQPTGGQRGRVRKLGPVGTLNNVTFLTNVPWHGRQWVIPMGKLATFLHTGKQFRKVGFIDGIVTNLKANNLAALDEITEERNPELAKTVLERARALFDEKTKKTMLTEIEPTKEQKTKQQVLMVPNGHGGMRPYNPKTDRDPRLPAQDVLMAELRMEDMLEVQAFNSTLLGQAMIVEQTKLADIWDELRLRLGLWTRISFEEVRKFYEHYKDSQAPMSAEPIIDELNARMALCVKEHDKLGYDLALASKMLYYEPKFGVESVQKAFDIYRWLDKEVATPVYDELMAGYVLEAEQRLDLVGRTVEEELEYIRYCLRHGLRVVPS